MYVTLAMVAKVVSVVSVLAGLIAALVTAIKRRAKEQEKVAELEQRIDEDEEKTATVRKSCREEQALIIYGLLACLKGLQEQGCDGPVTIAINKIERHINIKAHEE